MKFVALILAAVLATGCTRVIDMPLSSQGKVVYSTTNGSEVCYDGVVYVRFPSGDATWGSVKFDKTTKQPVTC